jgi:hypothetical protein
LCNANGRRGSGRGLRGAGDRKGRVHVTGDLRDVDRYGVVPGDEFRNKTINYEDLKSAVSLHAFLPAAPVVSRPWRPLSPQCCRFARLASVTDSRGTSPQVPGFSQGDDVTHTGAHGGRVQERRGSSIGRSIGPSCGLQNGQPRKGFKGCAGPEVTRRRGPESLQPPLCYPEGGSAQGAAALCPPARGPLLNLPGVCGCVLCLCRARERRMALRSARACSCRFCGSASEAGLPRWAAPSKAVAAGFGCSMRSDAWQRKTHKRQGGAAARAQQLG